MGTIRELILSYLEDRDSIAAINFIGYKNKKDIGKVVVSPEFLEIDLSQLKKDIECLLDNEGIKYKSILVEL